MFGSGTQGLHKRTLSPPPRLANSLPAREASRDGRGRELVAEVGSAVGGCTMN